MMFLAAISAAEVFKWIGYIIIAIFCLMFMIMIHETGHYVAGKLFHFKILEYSIGFGPKIFQRVNKTTGEKFSIRWIPLGGYCQFEGEDEDNPSEDAFNNKPVWQRIIVLFAGAFMNLLSAILFITIFFVAFGDFVPQVARTYDYVDESYEQQFEVGDIIYQIDGEYVYSLTNPTKLRTLYTGKDSVVATVERNGEIIELVVPIKDYYGTYVDEKGNVVEMSGTGVGISARYYETKLPFFRAFTHAFEFTWDEICLIFKTFVSLFKGTAKVSESMGGTITAISALTELAKNGFAAVMFGVCVLSASVGVMNLLPFPALDGCRIIFCIVEWIRRKPNNRKVEAIINLCGLAFLILMAITFDLLHFLG
ncbi:MAG: M50 family metallopeptidase [Clostridia bacterium]|nr:M50 family metallopeptidase [Clostridia bacterium]